jgi:tetratricopeptide (TPR) repeat protein
MYSDTWLMLVIIFLISLSIQAQSFLEEELPKKGREQTISTSVDIMSFILLPTENNLKKVENTLIEDVRQNPKKIEPQISLGRLTLLQIQLGYKSIDHIKEVLNLAQNSISQSKNYGLMAETLAFLGETQAALTVLKQGPDAISFYTIISGYDPETVLREAEDKIPSVTFSWILFPVANALLSLKSDEDRWSFVTRNPHPWLWFQLGNFYLEKEEEDKALKAFKQSSFPLSKLEIGIISLKTDPENSLKNLKSYLKEAKQDDEVIPQVTAIKSIAEFLLKKPQESLDSALSSINLTSSPDPIMEILWPIFSQYPDVLQTLAQAIVKKFPEESLGYFLMAYGLKAEDKTDESNYWLSKAKLFKPSAFLEQLRLQRSPTEEPLKAAPKLKTLEPDSNEDSQQSN